MVSTKKGQFGTDKTLKGDEVYGQLSNKLAEMQKSLPTTARKPDVRLIVKNTSNLDITFKNPGDHADQDEVIPSGEATMVMVHGNTLQEQQQNAKTLDKTYGLTKGGITDDFLEDLKNGAISDLVKEAYGPAPLEKQAGQLQDVAWKNEDGSLDDISPVVGENAAYGARPPSNEQVFIVRVPDDGSAVYLQGTNTSPEKLVSNDAGEKIIAVGVSPILDENWQPTGEVTTKPIAPSVAKGLYGEGYDSIPSVSLDGTGALKLTEKDRILNVLSSLKNANL